MKRFAFFCAACVLIVSAAPSYGVDRKYLDGAALQELNEDAPDFTIKGEGSRMIGLKDLRGKVIILHFWATWCKPCRIEFPAFERLYDDFKDKDFVFLAVSIDEKVSREELNEFAKTLGAGFPVYLAREGDVTDRYWSLGVPLTYFIDKKGRIAGRKIGPGNWDEGGAGELIKALLKER